MNGNSDNQIYYNGFINLLNISKYSNTSEILGNANSSAILSSSYIPDMRYCWSVPMPHVYPLMESNVLEAKR